VNREAQNGEGSLAIPESDHRSKQEHAGIVWISVAVVFHVEVLKPKLPERCASGGPAAARTKMQMSLDLHDLG
jgi:hypothetical protein